jgi:hypothetical protein
MPDNDNDLMQAAHKPLVLAIDLIGYELSHPDDRLAAALKEPSVYLPAIPPNASPSGP